MRCFIVEDELPAQRVLQKYLALIPGTEVVGTYQSAIEASAALQSTHVDTLFLDIRLPLLSGTDFLKTLVNSAKPNVIITTAYPEYAVEGFELDVVDYLVKPFSFERFLKAINKVRSFAATPGPVQLPSAVGPALFVNADKTLHKVLLVDILYLESVKDYVRIVLPEQKIMFLDNLKSWEEKLPAQQFARIHKSYIVNLDKIRKVHGNIVALPHAELPIGRTYRDDFFRRLQAAT
ncbi:response regulator transcription factor [Hymenobacter sp. BT664]|uniref:Response regulator transcription factor n=1 Tax=Hymenobacter montanus TaxID=2771359 RepID=A0A927BG83_9BACT|nr:LytTR family DNA-binding domain-containing protein [Hymenobacter montanus]MBD2769484.1 response regulator transcription factor [Hymenobacter montanus]